MHHSTPPAAGATSDHTGETLVLVGNPNVGKSAVFGHLTGHYVDVSNYPGTTVEVTRGAAQLAGARGEVVDTPGANGLIPMSEDELVTRSILVENPGASVMQVADMKNLRRALILTSQLSDLEREGAIALNMADEALSRGLSVDAEELERITGVPVRPTVAIRRDGIRDVAERSLEGRPFAFAVAYSDEIEEAIGAVVDLLPLDTKGRRGIALMVLAGDDTIAEWLRERLDEDALRIDETREELESRFTESISSIVSRARLAAIDGVVAKVLGRHENTEGRLLKSLTAWSTHRIRGLFVLAGVLYLTLWFVGILGAGTAVDFFETIVFGRYISPAAIWVADHSLPFPHAHEVDASEYTFAIPLTLSHEIELLTTVEQVTAPGYELLPGTELTGLQNVFRYSHDFLVGEYGAVTMAIAYGFAIVLPIVFTFFILFSLLVDSGYLPRLAVMTNKLFRVMGLNGKAVLPMILGLGCDTMATMTARILETKKERVVITLLLALGVPCSAQLGVILAMVASISLAGVLWWALTVLGVMLAVGWLAAKALPGETSDLVLELPPLRQPQLGNILVKTVARIEWYLKEVVPLFILGTALLFVLDAVDALRAIEDFAAPVVQQWLGLPAKATETFLIGFLRRDYGAAGLLVLQDAGMLDELQSVVSLVTITLFVPCVANVFVIAKERGLKTAVYMTIFIFPFAFLVGGILRRLILFTSAL